MNIPGVFKGMFPGRVFLLRGLGGIGGVSGMPFWNATLATRGSHGPYELCSRRLCRYRVGEPEWTGGSHGTYYMGEPEWTGGSHGTYCAGEPGGPGVLMEHTGWANPNVPRAGRVGGPECSRGRPRVVVCGMCSERRFG